MHRGEQFSIFSEYYKIGPLSDRFENDSARAVDVIIPIIHTNEMWRANLLSIYREIPVKQLLLGDGGCVDDSLDIAREFPRVEVLNHRDLTSLGYSIRHLIEATSTEWFVYLHSDVYLPPGWFDAMNAHRGEFDWFECNQRITVMADYLLDTTKVLRSYSGSQMGRKAAFDNVTPLIEDDFLYRNEDIIFAKLLERAGGRYGKVGDTHHFHQVMFKPSRWHRAIKRVAIEPEIGRDEDIRSNLTYAQGIIKYLEPSEATPDLVESVRSAIDRLIELEETTGPEFQAWVRKARPEWATRFWPDPVRLPARPAQAPHAVPAPIFTGRNRTADRIQQFAALYRLHGPRAVMLVAQQQGRRMAADAKTRSAQAAHRLEASSQFVYFGTRGALRKLIRVYRQGGAGGVQRFLKSKIFG